MLGLVIKNVGRIRERGYHIVEENDVMTKIINPKGEQVAEICFNEEALLSISIGQEKVENLEWIEIKIPFLPQKIVIEMKSAIDNDSKRIWAELPVKENQPIFWTTT